MNNGERKKTPPIDINKALKEKGKEHEKGPLTYVSNPGEGEDTIGGNKVIRRSSKTKINYTQLILAVGCSVLIFFVMSQFMLTSKDDSLTLLDNQRLLESNQASLETQLGTETARIENIIVSQADYAKKSEIQGFANSISNLDNKLNSIEALNLEERVTVLESDNQTQATENYLDYYLEGDILTIKVARSGYYIVHLTLIPKDTAGGFVGNITGLEEYYSRSYNFNAGESVSKHLPVEITAYLSSHNVFVEVLPGCSVEGEDTDSWL